jgi:hypothetical protein
MNLSEALAPQLDSDPRPTSPDDAGAHYVRSFLLMRIVIGLIGVGLPLALILVEWGLFDGDLRDSMSAYYYTGMREVFVGSLCATAVFLLTYKAFRRNLDNTLTSVAGLAALLVALFPTGRPSGAVAGLTPLQDKLGETAVRVVHYASAAVFIISLGVICVFFGIREGRRDPSRKTRWSPAAWRRFHFACAGVIAAALVFMLIAGSAGLDPALLAGEWTAAWAFGASWFLKGYERDALKATSTDRTAAEAA